MKTLLIAAFASALSVLPILTAYAGIDGTRAASAEELPPGCRDLQSTWVRGDTTEDQTGSFVTQPVEGLGLKWASWKDGDQSISINFMSGTWEGVMCMTTAKVTAPIVLTCAVPGLTVIATKAPAGLVEVMACVPPEKKPAPKPSRVVPLPKAKVRS